MLVVCWVPSKHFLEGIWPSSSSPTCQLEQGLRQNTYAKKISFRLHVSSFFYLVLSAIPLSALSHSLSLFLTLSLSLSLSLYLFLTLSLFEQLSRIVWGHFLMTSWFGRIWFEREENVRMQTTWLLFYHFLIYPFPGKSSGHPNATF